MMRFGLVTCGGNGFTGAFLMSDLQFIQMAHYLNFLEVAKE